MNAWWPSRKDTDAPDDDAVLSAALGDSDATARIHESAEQHPDSATMLNFWKACLASLHTERARVRSTTDHAQASFERYLRERKKNAPKRLIARSHPYRFALGSAAATALIIAVVFALSFTLDNAAKSIQHVESPAVELIAQPAVQQTTPFHEGVSDPLAQFTTALNTAENGQTILLTDDVIVSVDVKIAKAVRLESAGGSVRIGGLQ